MFYRGEQPRDGHANWHPPVENPYADVDVEDQKEDEKKLGHLRVEYGTEQHRQTRSWLVNGAQVNIEPLLSRDLIDRQATTVRLADDARQEGNEPDEIEAETVTRVQDQLRATPAGSNEQFVDTFSNLIRMVGEQDQVGLLRKDEGPGLDKWQIGNAADLDKGPVFVIAASREKQVRGILDNPPVARADDAVFQLRDNRPYQSFLYRDESDHEQQLGFTVWYEVTTGGRTQELPITFLFGQEREDMEATNDNNSADEDNASVPEVKAA